MAAMHIVTYIHLHCPISCNAAGKDAVEHNVEFLIMKHIIPQLAYQTPIAFSVLYNGTCVKLCQVTCIVHVTDTFYLFHMFTQTRKPKLTTYFCRECACM